MTPTKAASARVCPICGQTYTRPPALSRTDNATPICPECGCRQAMSSIGIPPDEQEHILALMRRRNEPKSCV